jgi:DNA-binding GntR family transcriptional regulator
VSVEEEDPRSYVRIATALRSRIDSGELKHGQPVPSITTLSQRYGVARATAAKALRLLESEGKVKRYPGLGYFVA